MATVSTRYGRLSGEGWLEFSEDGREQVGARLDSSLTFPVDLLFLLSSDNKDDLERGLAEMVFHYYMAGLLSPPRKPEDAAEHEARMWRSLRRRVQKWRRDGVLDGFLRAAKRATEGRLTAELGPHLERIRYGGAGQPDEVHEFLPLAAWSVDQALRAGKYKLRKCELCSLPFLSSGRPRYCQRLAPRAELVAAMKHPSAQLIKGPTCQDVGKVKDYRARRRRQRQQVVSHA